MIDQFLILHLESLLLLFSLKNETARTVETIDQQIQEQEKLRQNARTMLSILQRTKVQLIELRPTMSGEGDQKLTVRRLSILVNEPSFFVLETR